MIRISKRLWCFAAIGIFGWLAGSSLACATDIASEPENHNGCRVEHMDVQGLAHTDESWLRAYVGLTFPRDVSEEDAVAVRNHLMTTDIFTDVRVVVRRLNADLCDLDVHIVEKWTLIPVVRGAYGGGTPLLVVGGYQTNAFGKLRAIGGEIRKYGTLAPGFFLFAKSPRAWNGSGSYGGELWLDRRRRSFLDDDGMMYGYADSEAWTFKYELLYPLGEHRQGGGHLQGGVHLDLVRENATTFSDKHGDLNPMLKPADVSIPTLTTSSSLLMPMVVYDHVTVDGMEMGGLRGMFRAGGQVADTKYRGATESEVFWYEKLPLRLNMAVHGFAGRQGSDTLRNLYFLGGFDSVRGLPDGVHYGKTIAYGNFEMRWLALESKFLHVQPAIFGDHGTAFSEINDAYAHRESAVGVGLRFAVPQVYRLLVRVDYGWSVGHTKTRGLSIGLGQFFQPYKLFF